MATFPQAPVSIITISRFTTRCGMNDLLVREQVLKLGNGELQLVQ